MRYAGILDLSTWSVGDVMPGAIDEHIGIETDYRTVIDAAGTVVAINQRLAHALGRPADQIIGQYFWDYVDASSLASSLEVLDDVSVRNIDRSQFVNCLRSALGEALWIVWRVDRIRADGLIYCRGEPSPAPA